MCSQPPAHLNSTVHKLFNQPYSHPIDKDVGLCLYELSSSSFEVWEYQLMYDQTIYIFLKKLLMIEKPSGRHGREKRCKWSQTRWFDLRSNFK